MRRIAALALAALVALLLALAGRVRPAADVQRRARSHVDAQTRRPDASPSPEPRDRRPTRRQPADRHADPSPTATDDRAGRDHRRTRLPRRDDAPVAVDAAGRPIATGRYIVVLADRADTNKVLTRHRQREGTRAERAFRHAFRGFTAKLDAGQRSRAAVRPERRRGRPRRGDLDRRPDHADRRLDGSGRRDRAWPRSTASTSGSMPTWRSSIRHRVAPDLVRGRRLQLLDR